MTDASLVRASLMGTTLVVAVVGCLMASGPVRGQAKTPLDPLVAVLDADPLELARLTRLLGDAELIARLGGSQPIEVRLAATRAARFMRQPELALTPLTTLAAERDGVLAQAATRALLAIVRELDRDVLSRHEVDPQSLVPVREQLRALSEREHLRADLRADVNAALAMLTALIG